MLVILEAGLVFGGMLAFAVYELIALKRDARRKQADDQSSDRD